MNSADFFKEMLDNDLAHNKNALEQTKQMSQIITVLTNMVEAQKRMNTMLTIVIGQLIGLLIITVVFR